ncbi:MAG TPA: hypothetical protein VM103_01840 [Candidatus Paceibacterota bacterium]|nr:hypothetical protein [Candidatus Paceibacterota bacterium]
MEKLPSRPKSSEDTPPAVNLNSIGEVIALGSDLETTPDLVYRVVHGDEAIADFLTIGHVRNAQSAGAVPKSRWGERVFWSRGKAGRSFGFPQDSFVIVAPYSIANQKFVEKEDVVAIYGKDSAGKVINVLETPEIEL